MRTVLKSNGKPVALEHAASAERVVVVIPALNEEASLPSVIHRLHQIGLFQIRVVDNGSYDRTAEVARQTGAEVVTECRRGYGQACWTGCKDLPASAKWVLFCNADGSDDIERVPAFLEATSCHGEFILGARVADTYGQDGLTPTQRFGNRLATSLIRRCWGAQYADLGPLRLISRQSLVRLNMQNRGFGWTVEMQVRAFEEGLKIVELPVRNFARTAGVSKISGNVMGSIQAGSIILTTIAWLWLKRLVR